jgi:hypothetical protein
MLRPSEPSGERDGALPSSRSDISNRRDGSLVWASSCDARTKLTREEMRGIRSSGSVSPFGDGFCLIEFKAEGYDAGADSHRGEGS